MGHTFIIKEKKKYYNIDHSSLGLSLKIIRQYLCYIKRQIDSRKYSIIYKIEIWQRLSF